MIASTWLLLAKAWENSWMLPVSCDRGILWLQTPLTETKEITLFQILSHVFTKLSAREFYSIHRSETLPVIMQQLDMCKDGNI